MTWSEFKAAVKVDLPVDNKRLNIATGNPNFLDSQILHAVVMIQKQIPFYQQGHETVYGQPDLVMEGLASVGSLPQYDQCRPVDAHYKKVGSVCVSQPLVPYDWGNRLDLVCGVPRSSCEFFIAIDPQGKQFTVFPSVQIEHQINLNWNGVKVSFNDTDVVPFEDDVVEAVATFCKAKIALHVDHDSQEYTLLMQEWKFLKAHLHADSRDRVRLSATAPSPQPTRFTPCCDAGGSCPPVSVENTVSLCLFGDSGEQTYIDNTEAVSNLVKALEPDYVVHLGDIVYPHGEPVNIHDCLLKFYQMYLPNRMFWSPGNHDVETDGGASIQALFGRQNTLNQGKRYWDFIPPEQTLHLFVLDSMLSSPLDEQMSWLQSKLAVSSEFWNVVCFHKPPYTSDSSHYPGEVAFRQPYADWGAHLVIAAHGHNYERIHGADGMTYLNPGLGGAIKRGFVATPVVGSQFQYNAFYGALYLTARSDRLTASFYNTLGDVVDSFALENVQVTQP